MLKVKKSMTLMEVLIYVVLLSVIVLAIANIYSFSHYQVVASERRHIVQSELSFIQEHFKKQLMRAVGYCGTGVTPISIAVAGANTTIVVLVDDNNNGRADSALGPDANIAYRWTNATHVFSYFTDFNAVAPVGAGEQLSNRIVAATFTNNWDATCAAVNNDNSVGFRLTACWNPNDPNIAFPVGADPQGTADNPCVTMDSRAYMPAVSTH